MYEEAFAREEARREEERQRSHRRRYGFAPPPPVDGMPGWCTSRPATDDAKQKKYREQAYKLMVKALHKNTGEHEAAACRGAAERIRAKYRL